MSGNRKLITRQVLSNGCEICTSHTPNTHGYPKLWKSGVGQNMHRVLYEEAFGPISFGLVVRHTCDNRQCINLSHLELGTPGDNSKDRNERGRNNPPHGERSGTSKVTLREVKHIRNSPNTQVQLALKYSVSQSQISRIQSGKRWGKFFNGK